MADYESGYDPKYGYNKNAFAHGTPVTNLLGKGVRLIATAAGLASEAIHNSRDDKGMLSNSANSEPVQEEYLESAASHIDRSNNQEEVSVNVDADQDNVSVTNVQPVSADEMSAAHDLVAVGTTVDGIDCDEVDWELDEAAAQIDPPAYEAATRGGNSNRTEVHNSAVSSSTAQHKLPFPVIIPQRRPGTKARGFIRAYAPILKNSGVDQDTFLRFLKDFHKAAQASPIFNVVRIASTVAGFYPDLVVGAAALAVQVGVKAAQEVQERWRTNKFLDQANKDIFMPKGHFAFIVTYKPSNDNESNIRAEAMDIGATAFARYGDTLARTDAITDRNEGPQKGKMLDDMKRKSKSLRIASAKTYGERETPIICAPLEFPALNPIADATVEDGPEKGTAKNLKARTNNASKFVSDYIDRRAQATYAAKHPDSTLTKQMAAAAPKFKSRFADPNNATNKHFFTLITGGRVKATPLGGRRRWERAQRKAAESQARGYTEVSSKRVLQEDVLYLMIVNMPTEAELERARKRLREEKEAVASSASTG